MGLSSRYFKVHSDDVWLEEEVTLHRANSFSEKWFSVKYSLTVCQGLQLHFRRPASKRIVSDFKSIELFLTYKIKKSTKKFKCEDHLLLWPVFCHRTPRMWAAALVPWTCKASVVCRDGNVFSSHSGTLLHFGHSCKALRVCFIYYTHAALPESMHMHGSSALQCIQRLMDKWGQREIKVLPNNPFHQITALWILNRHWWSDFSGSHINISGGNIWRRHKNKFNPHGIFVPLCFFWWKKDL